MKTIKPKLNKHERYNLELIRQAKHTTLMAQKAKYKQKSQKDL